MSWILEQFLRNLREEIVIDMDKPTFLHRTHRHGRTRAFAAPSGGDRHGETIQQTRMLDFQLPTMTSPPNSGNWILDCASLGSGDETVLVLIVSPSAYGQYKGRRHSS